MPIPFRTATLAALGALMLSAPLAAKPADYARVIADPARSADDRKLDEGRKPAEILDFAGVRKGQVVVDFFAGSGYYSTMIARAVGPRGTVYVLNPPSFHDPKGWDPLLPRYPNIRVLVAEVAAMQLAPGSVDTIFTNLNYHDLYWESAKNNYPRIDVPAVLAGWFRAVRPGGHVVIVDHAGPAGDPREVVEKMHRIDPAQVKADMAAAGFVLEAESAVLSNPADDHTKGVFNPAVRGKTDRFALKFRRP